MNTRWTPWLLYMAWLWHGAGLAQPLSQGPSRITQAHITHAHYARPTERYGHFALGRPHEYAQVVASTSSGQRLVFDLPENEVFEDLAPRLVHLGGGQAPLLLSIVSSRSAGARLVLLGLHEGALRVRAQSAAVGTPTRWLNPVAVADLDGDGRAEVAAVITPHIGGLLTAYRLEQDRLEPIARARGFSNHEYGSPELALSLALPIAGRMHLLVPDRARTQLRMMALDTTAQGVQWVERGRCTLPAPVSGGMVADAAGSVSMLLQGQRHTLHPAACIR